MESISAELITNEKKRDLRGRRFYDEKRKSEIVQEWRDSGLTQRVYAQKVGVNYGTLVSWVSGRRFNTVGETKPSAFEQVSFPPESLKSSLEIILPDGTKLRGGNAQELAELARELRVR